MTPKRSRTGRLSLVGGVAALVLGLAVAYQPVASSAAPGIAAPVVTVTPSTGLSDNDTVEVDATGLTPSTLQHVGQCIFVNPVTFACNEPELVHVSSDSSGAISDVELTVRRTFTATLADGTVWGTADCDVMQCFVGVGDDTGNGGGAPISFS